ncbi:class I SAM-dependent methyltransferase [Streptomyces violascens]|uniref:class I SAM-dependent methyltransferase n=1 Tax=Streptomyces violascens TaxID=67381 RepID=UPI0036AE3F2E
MRLELRGDTLLERFALRTPLLPLPAVQTVAGMAMSGALIASARLGLVEELAGRPGTVEELASRLTLRTGTARLLLDALQSLGYLKVRRGRYMLTRRAKRWLLPSSDVSVNHVMASMTNLWPLWMDLPAVARGKEIADHHAIAPDDDYWHDYITGQYEMARLTAPETVAAIRVPPQSRSVLDIAGGHGHFAAELCRRHPALRATVLDLPGSAAVGRDIVRQAGADHLVTYRQGDARTTDLGTNYDVVLCFNLIHHLQPDEIPALFRRVHTALRPGGTFAVLGMFLEPGNRRRPHADECARGLLFHLTSNGTLYSPAQLTQWLTEARFAAPTRTRLRRSVGQWLYQTTALR